ncbi:MAG TPA: MarC family protein [Terriglobales bacterium]|jgi:multiple antibiotic resistance protein|nr:MarC family protein [Terriglobales bacterium]
MSLVLKYFVLAFSALLPVINPLGSALIFLGVVGSAPSDVFRNLARRVAIATVLFLLIIELVGAAILTFFGISLPVVQLAGGFVLAGMGWGLLNDKDEGRAAKQTAADASATGTLEEKIFYPLTFPITAGPGCIVVMLTLSAHASQTGVLANVLGHLGIAVAVLALSFSVFVSYNYAPKITQKIAPQTAQGVLRVIAFVLMCIGVQIAANGLAAMIAAVRK